MKANLLFTQNPSQVHQLTGAVPSKSLGNPVSFLFVAISVDAFRGATAGEEKHGSWTETVAASAWK